VYLHEQPGRGLGPATLLEQMPGKTPVDRVLAGFEKWLGPSAELEALRLLGFFDRPADEGCLQALRATPAIPGLTELVAGMADADWHRVLAGLDKLRLIHARHGETGNQFVETHPIIREHFAVQLREKNPDAWREGHRRLYEHLCATTNEGDQPTLEDLQPLYQAVAHGCQAGMQQEVCDKVYFTRILRGQEHYSWKKLGSFGPDLGAIACFFTQPWSRISAVVTESDQAWLLHQAALYLHALGRLTESLEPMRAGLPIELKRGDFKNAAIRTSNLSELELTLGEISGAVADAEESVTYADRSGDAFQRMVNRCTSANALHQAGRRAEAETRFHEAKQIQAERQPNYPLLYSLQGFHYCDLLLAAPERAASRQILSLNSQPSTLNLIESCRSVSKRGKKMFEWRVPSDSLLDIALDYLTLGRAALYAAILEGFDFRRLTSDLSHIDAAVTGLRRAGTTHHIPRGLLPRAWLRFLTGARTGPDSAQEDLNEAWEIAERGPMKLHMANIHLYRARLFGNRKGMQYPWESPAADLAAAEKLINECGYHRRDEELADAKAAIL
jgi:hypothetical protein